MNSKKWIAWDQKGWIIGPHETEEEYQKRVEFCSRETEELQKNLKTELPFVSPHETETMYYTSPMRHVQNTYDTAPTWVPLLFHNKGLSFWHGGCAWIYTLSEKHPCSAFLQLRRSFAKKKTLLGMIDRDEVIAHEMVHVARMAFDEPVFEEMFAYHLSFSRWRRWWGPILQAPWEAHLFLASVVIPLVCTLIGIVDQIDFLIFWGSILLVLPFFLFLIGTLRLVNKHHQLNRCLRQLSLFIPKKEVWSVALRLTDREIRTFGKMSPEGIRNYAKQTKEFRWQVLTSRWPF